MNIVSVAEAFERGRAISDVPRHVRDYGDWRVILIRYIFSRDATSHDLWKGRKSRAKNRCRSAAGCAERVTGAAWRRSDVSDWRTYGATFRYLSGRTRIGGMQSLHCRSYRVVTCRLVQFWIMPLFTFAYYVTQLGDTLYMPHIYDITLAPRKIILRLCYRRSHA